MPSQLDVKKVLNAHSARVKCVHFHPTETWVLSALYSGSLVIHNWEEQTTVKIIEVCPGVPVRSAKFIPQEQWVICGSDDMHIRVFNYHTLEKVKEFEAHCDFIRCIAIHPTLPYVLTTSDDMTIRLWDWSKKWTKIATFEGHIHYVMMCHWNPRDPHIFASASLDRNIYVWGLPPTGLTTTDVVVDQPHFKLIGHEGGVNTVQYSASEKPYLISGGDDHTVRIWDYQTKQCIMTLNNNNKNVTCALIHSFLPVILTGGDEPCVKIWDSNTYSQEMSIYLNMGRVWGIDAHPENNAIAFANDDGIIVLRIGSDRIVASMQKGKIILARGCDIQSINIKLTDTSNYADGDVIPTAVKDLGACEIFPQSIQHHPKGRLVCVSGDGEFVIYTPQALRSKAFGRAAEFVWSSSGDYATRDDASKIVVYHEFKEELSYTPPYTVERLFGGHLIGLKGADFICFHDWREMTLKRRINVDPSFVFWNEAGTQVILACETSFYSLRYDSAAVPTDEDDLENDGIEAAFKLEQEVMEVVESGCWVAECFVFTTKKLRIHTFAAGIVDTLGFLEKPAWILGYIEETNRLYLIDHDYSIISYVLYLSYIEYMSAIMRHSYDTAQQIFKHIPESLHNKVARFLERKGQREIALEVTKDPDHKFELARSLGKLSLCAQLIQEASGSQAKSDVAKLSEQWRQLGDLALSQGVINLAEACYEKGKDYNSLLMIYTSTGDLGNMKRLAEMSKADHVTNVAMLCCILVQDYDQCLQILLETNRIPEAALFARAYAPSKIPQVVALWQEKLIQMKYPSIAASITDPATAPDMFPEYETLLEMEKKRSKEGVFAGSPSSVVSETRDPQAGEVSVNQSSGGFDPRSPQFPALGSKQAPREEKTPISPSPPKSLDSSRKKSFSSAKSTDQSAESSPSSAKEAGYPGDVVRETHLTTQTAGLVNDAESLKISTLDATTTISHQGATAFEPVSGSSYADDAWFDNQHDPEDAFSDTD